MSMTTQGIKTSGKQLPDESVDNAPKPKSIVVAGAKPPASNNDFGKGVSNGPDDYQKDGSPRY